MRRGWFVYAVGGGQRVVILGCAEAEGADGGDDQVVGEGAEACAVEVAEDVAAGGLAEEVADVLRGRVRAAKVTMDRVRKALEAGWDPAELRDQYNAVAAEKQVAERALAALPEQQTLGRDQLVTYVRELGDVGWGARRGGSGGAE